jgi:hypothetical protein
LEIDVVVSRKLKSINLIAAIVEGHVEQDKILLSWLISPCMSFHRPLRVPSSSKGGAKYLKVIAQEARFGEMNASMSDRLINELDP